MRTLYFVLNVATVVAVAIIFGLQLGALLSPIATTQSSSLMVKKIIEGDNDPILATYKRFNKEWGIVQE